MLSTRSAKILYTLGVCLFLAACSGAATPTISLTAEAVFATSVPMATMNTIVTLRYLKPQLPDKQLDYGLNLVLENQSDQEVWFPIDFGIKLYQFSEGEVQWQIVENTLQYTLFGTDNGIIVAPHGVNQKSPPRSWQVGVSAFPKLDSLTHSIVIRVVVLGNIYNHGNKGEPVGAYTDVVITP
jgi:hypothetical protein